MRKFVVLIFVAAVVIQVGMSADEPPSASYQQNMQAAAALGLAGYGTATSPRNDVDRARALQASFGAMETYWAEKKIAAAVDLARAGRDAAVEFETAATSNNREAVTAARRKVSGVCVACHLAYANRLPDGKLEIKIPQAAGTEPGAGAGIGQGTGRGAGDGVLRPGTGITAPLLTARTDGQYTANAMLMRIQGEVLMSCVVQATGECSDIHIERSVDPVFGLDEQAVKAVQQWRFRPAIRQGEPVPVRIRISLQFSIR